MNGDPAGWIHLLIYKLVAIVDIIPRKDVAMAGSAGCQPASSDASPVPCRQAAQCHSVSDGEAPGSAAILAAFDEQFLCDAGWKPALPGIVQIPSIPYA